MRADSDDAVREMAAWALAEMGERSPWMRWANWPKRQQLTRSRTALGDR